TMAIERRAVEVAHAQPQCALQRVPRFVFADFGVQIADRGGAESEARDTNTRRRVRTGRGIGHATDRINRHRGNPRLDRSKFPVSWVDYNSIYATSGCHRPY